MAEVTTYVCDAVDVDDDGCTECTNDATVTALVELPGRGAPHDERAATLELDLCDEHVTAYREFYRPNVADEPAGNGRPTYTCKRCGYGPTTGAGLAAHQRATGHGGRNGLGSDAVPRAAAATGRPFALYGNDRFAAARAVKKRRRAPVVSPRPQRITSASPSRRVHGRYRGRQKIILAGPR
jgi:hypothetical protein